MKNFEFNNPDDSNFNMMNMYLFAVNQIHQWYVISSLHKNPFLCYDTLHELFSMVQPLILKKPKKDTPSFCEQFNDTLKTVNSNLDKVRPAVKQSNDNHSFIWNYRSQANPNGFLGTPEIVDRNLKIVDECYKLLSSMRAKLLIEMQAKSLLMPKPNNPNEAFGGSA